MKHLEQAGEVDRADVACSTSTLDHQLHDSTDETRTVPDSANDDAARSLAQCLHCSKLLLCASCDTG